MISLKQLLTLRGAWFNNKIEKDMDCGKNQAITAKLGNTWIISVGASSALSDAQVVMLLTSASPVKKVLLMLKVTTLAIATLIAKRVPTFSIYLQMIEASPKK